MSPPFNQTRPLKRVKELFNAQVCRQGTAMLTAYLANALGSSRASHHPLLVTVHDGERRGLLYEATLGGGYSL